MEDFNDLLDIANLAELNDRTRVVTQARVNPCEDYTDKLFMERFRLSKTCFIILLAKIEKDIFQAAGLRGYPVEPHLQLLITLRYLATSNDQLSNADLYGVSQSYVSRCISNVGLAIARLLPQYIMFPEDLKPIKKTFRDMSNMPGIIGCIDCTHIAIQMPTLPQPERFRNRRGYFSINVQAVCGPNLKFLDVVARWPGSTHDSNIFNNSRLCQRLEDKILNGILLGDSGYACMPYLLTPLQQPVSMAEMNYQKAIYIRTRNCVERAFGVLKRRFAFMGKKARTNFTNTQNLILACFVLHNMCIEYGGVDVNDSQNCGGEGNDNFDTDNNNENLQGKIIRRNIINNYFQ